ncbi:hypothetical protein TWF506_006786 [Arthrobotrys conoides]|uniref:Uncharacterized protein n=1 Tax=Arthrobotrys conoides TaxID=74498 RepID=A0AAN8RVD9_9PEZI
MKGPSSSIFSCALVAQVLVSLYVTNVYGLIIKVRHYDFIRGRTYDLNLCRPLTSNKIVLLQEKCDPESSMPGWRAREGSSDYEPPRTVVDLFGPPFGPVTRGTYEEPRPWASWSGSLFYNKDPWRPIMFRSSYDPEEGYEWRLPFESQRNGEPIATTPTKPLQVGDTLEPTNNVDDPSGTMLQYSSVVSCDSPSGRVLRRAPSFTPANLGAGPVINYNSIRRYGDADCRTVKFIVSDLGYIDPANPVLPPADPYPLDLMPITEESFAASGDSIGSLQDPNDEAEINQFIDHYMSSPESEEFDRDVFKYQLEDIGSLDDLDRQINELEDEGFQK